MVSQRRLPNTKLPSRLRTGKSGSWNSNSYIYAMSFVCCELRWTKRDFKGDIIEIRMDDPIIGIKRLCVPR